jgi:DNA processing protein
MAGNDRGARGIGGSIFNTKLDLTHPIGYGFNDDDVTVFRSSTMFLEKGDNPYSTPLYYTDDPLASGYISDENLEEIKGTAAIIVSGYAYGVDICAHKVAIKNNLQTIAVLAHGFEQIYPKVHKKYINQVNENGGFLTEFWSEEQPLRENFLKRNRIVAGISKATIIIESAEKGGSLVTADIANSYNRDVFAVPGRANDIYSKGCNNLIKNNRATLLTSSEDIVKMLNWDIQKTPKKVIQKQLFIDLNENEQKIYDLLSDKGQQLLDVISLECNIPIYQLSSILLQMEMKGITKPLPGKLFELM